MTDNEIVVYMLQNKYAEIIAKLLVLGLTRDEADAKIEVATRCLR